MLKTFKTVFLLSIISSSIVSFSGLSAEDPFAELELELEQHNKPKSDLEEFERWKKNHLSEYEAFRKDYFIKLDKFRNENIKKWGSSEPSSPEKYITYNADNVKTVVDFEKNEITISVLHEKDEEVKKDIFSKYLNETNNEFKNTLTNINSLEEANDIITSSASITENSNLSQSNTELLEQEIKVIDQQTVKQQQQLEKRYDLKNIDQVNPSSVVLNSQKQKLEKEKQERIAFLKAELNKQNKSKLKENLKTKKITSYTIPMQSNKALKKAEPYLSDVQKESARWDLPMSLMLAIMHTESYFNPKAKSHIPAYGLMQVVPNSAGIDVNRFLFEKDEAMSEDALFTPSKNIEAGVAYMHILNSKYLKSITNDESRAYCIIAAYNTGSGNVAKTFNSDGSRNINKASKIINTLTPSEVYDVLVDKLPYEETRNYVKKVTKRQNIYLNLDKT